MSEIITIPIQNLSRFSVELDLDYLYLFTDNLNRSSGHNYIDEYNEYCIIWAKGRQIYYPNSSQAVIRGLENAYPISTMVNQYKKQFTDDMFELFKENLDEEINSIKKVLDYKYEGIKYVDNVFGIGTYSKMNVSAPKCFEYLHLKLKEINIEQLR